MAKRADSDTVQLKWRTKEPLRAALEQAASHRGVSINQEMTRRIEISFMQQTRVDEAFGSQEIFGLMKIVATAFVQAGAMAGHLVSTKNFVENPFAYDQATRAAIKVLEAFRPSGEIAPPPKVSGLSEMWAGVVDQINADPASILTEGLLDQVRAAAGLETKFHFHTTNEEGELRPTKPSQAAERLSKGIGSKLARRLRTKKGADK